ncbi:MAG: hypothetical protein K0U79_01855 [Gammaproteobacteria bacterium]|nr:hypothetical protein [Gammaproteobacteria bacterium]
MIVAAWTVLFAVLGFAAGSLHIASLARNVRLLTGAGSGGGGSGLQAAGLLVLRFAVSGLVLVSAVHYGPLPLLAALGGWHLARSCGLRAEPAS